MSAFGGKADIKIRGRQESEATPDDLPETVLPYQTIRSLPQLHS